MTQTQNVTSLPAKRYDVIAIGFHWVMAVLIGGAAIMGLMIDDVPRGPPRFAWVNTHSVIGASILVLVVLRLVWRKRNPPPALPADMHPLEKKVSTPVHHLLYTLIVLVPVFGVVNLFYRGRGIDFGFFQIQPGILQNRSVVGVVAEIHSLLAFSLMGLVGLHTVAALWHQFYRRDNLIGRMLPWK